MLSRALSCTILWPCGFSGKRTRCVERCHRVAGKNEKLVGYGGRLWRKQHLLNLERDHA
jgi:hypothetical protein